MIKDFLPILLILSSLTEDSLPELKQGFTVELFRLKTKIENKQYFEIAEHVKVLNPYTDPVS